MNDTNTYGEKMVIEPKGLVTMNPKQNAHNMWMRLTLAWARMVAWVGYGQRRRDQNINEK